MERPIEELTGTAKPIPLRVRVASDSVDRAQTAGRATVRITTDRGKFLACSHALACPHAPGREQLLEKWEEDKGKEITVLLPPVPVTEEGGERCWIAAPETIARFFPHLPPWTRVFLCEHDLDID
ncbi:MAG: hypothetical protein WBC04_19425 [Candidatus Acidiferrales bacterium]